MNPTNSTPVLFLFRWEEQQTSQWSTYGTEKSCDVMMDVG